MEALAALSLACNVFQLVEIALKVGRSVKEVYQQGSSVDQQDLRVDTIRLCELADNVRSSPLSTSHLSVNADDATLRIIAADSVHISEQLQDELNKLISKGGIAGSLKVVFKTHRKKGIIDKLVQRLELYQRRLDSELLVSLRTRMNGLISDQKVAFETLDDRSREFLNLLNTRFTQLETTIDTSAAETRATIIDHVDTKIEASNVQSNLMLSQELDIRGKRQQEIDSQRILVEQLQQSFWYQGIRERVNLIDTSDKKQYAWLFDPKAYHERTRNMKGSWSSVSDWLISDGKVYWVQGKPGSGKSTLMKMLWQSFNTEWLLSEGSHRPDTAHPDRQRYNKKKLSHKPCILNHSFWLSSSNDMQRSFKGLLHSLLYQLAIERPDALTTSFTNSMSMIRSPSFHEWQRTELVDLLFIVLTQLSQSCPVCLFLDGLDEILPSEDRDQMTTFLNRCSEVGNVKTCVSSRYDYPWIDAFVGVPQLRLQDLTRSDINEFAKVTLDRAWGCEDILDVEDKKERGKILEEITSRAEGVFLWVHLALRSLLDSSKHATWSEKRERLDSLPEGIIDLYLDMLSRRGHDPKTAKREAATYLKLCLEYQTTGGQSPFPTGAFLHHCVILRARHFSGRASLEYTSSYKAFHKQYIQLHERIQQICAGMIRLVATCFLSESDLEAASRNHIDTKMVTEPLNDLIGQVNVSEANTSRLRAMHAFLHHRTVSDFLVDTPSGQSFLQNCTLTPLEVFSAYVEAELARVRLGIALCDSKFVKQLLERICRFENGPGSPSQIEIAQLVRNVYNAILEQHLNTRGRHVDSQVSTEQKTYHLFMTFSDVEAKEDNGGYDFRNTFAVATDLQSLALLHGISSCFFTHLAPLLNVAERTDPTLSQAYKDYILFCAVRGGLDKIAVILLEHGANLYADLFPPQPLSWKTCAATELLLHLSTDSRLKDEWKAKATEYPRRQDISRWQSVVQRSGYATSYVLVASGNRMIEGNHRSGTAMGGLNYITRFRPMDQDLTSDVYFLIDVKAHLQWLMERMQQHCLLRTNFVQEPPASQLGLFGVALLPESCLMSQQIMPYSARSLFGYNSVESQAPEEQFHNYASYQSCPFCLLRENDELWTNLIRRIGFPAEPILKSQFHWAVRDVLNARDYFYKSGCFAQPHGPCSVISAAGKSRNKQQQTLTEGESRTYFLIQPEGTSINVDEHVTKNDSELKSRSNHEAMSSHDIHSHSGHDALDLLIGRINELSMNSSTKVPRPHKLIMPGGRRKQGLKTWIVEGANDWIKEIGKELGLLKTSPDAKVMRGPIPMFATFSETSATNLEDLSLDDEDAPISPVSRASTTFFDAEE